MTASNRLSALALLGAIGLLAPAARGSNTATAEAPITIPKPLTVPASAEVIAATGVVRYVVTLNPGIGAAITGYDKSDNAILEFNGTAKGAWVRRYVYPADDAEIRHPRGRRTIEELAIDSAHKQLPRTVRNGAGLWAARVLKEVSQRVADGGVRETKPAAFRSTAATSNRATVVVQTMPEYQKCTECGRKADDDFLKNNVFCSLDPLCWVVGFAVYAVQSASCPTCALAASAPKWPVPNVTCCEWSDDGKRCIRRKPPRGSCN